MKSMNLVCRPLLNGIMANWDQIEEAKDYIVTLYINDTPISTRINPRAELYCSFTGLAAVDGTTPRLLSDMRMNIDIRNNGYGGYGGGRLEWEKHDQPIGDNYYVQVEAENREGEIVARSEKVIGTIKEL